jgi:hypothetical protein
LVFGFVLACPQSQSEAALSQAKQREQVAKDAAATATTGSLPRLRELELPCGVGLLCCPLGSTAAVAWSHLTASRRGVCVQS